MAVHIVGPLFQTSSSTVPLLTPVQPHSFKNPRHVPTSGPLYYCLARRAFPTVLSPVGSISSSRSQLKCHLLREALLDLPKQPHPAFPVSSKAVHFLYKSPPQCPSAFTYVYCLSPQEANSTRGGPRLLTISMPGASKPLQKGFLSRVLPPCLYHHDLHENSSRNHGSPFQKGLEQMSTPIHCLRGQSLHPSREPWGKLGIGVVGASPSSLLTSPPPGNQETGGSPG